MTYSKLKEEFNFLDDIDLEIKYSNYYNDSFESYLINKIHQLQNFLKEYKQYKTRLNNIENNN